MEERKTAAIVLGILALIIIFFTLILPEIRYRSTQTIAFKNCKVEFKYWDKNLIPDIERVAQNKLALCLCESYKQKPDTALAHHIIQIYKQYGNPYTTNSLHINNNIDSIIKYKNAALDTLILVD